MKNRSYFLLTIFSVVTFGGGAQQESSAHDESGVGQTATASARDPQAGVAAPATGSPDNTVRLNFTAAPLMTVLNYLSEVYGFIITGRTDIRARVSIIANAPVNAADAVNMINEQLVVNGYQAVQSGRTLNIMSVADAKKAAGTPVHDGANPANIPINGVVVTQILPVRSLNPSQFTKDLQALFPEQDTITPNEACNALIMTAPQGDIHRLAQILQALDSTTVSDVHVFLLRFGDATSIASELKDIFTDPNAQQNTLRSAARTRFGGGPGGGGGETDSSLPATRVNAVADTQDNAVLVSAPIGYMDGISNLVAQLDQPSEDVTQVRVFRLKHADPTETASELAALFSDDTSTSSTASRTTGVQFGGPGGGGPGGFFGGPGGGPPGFGGGPGMSGNGSSSTQQSDRAKRKSRVLAVADLRTGSIIVTSAKNLMDQLAGIIASLDSSDANEQKLAFFDIGHADSTQVQTLMQYLFQSANARTSSSSSTQSALQQRETQMQQQSSSSASTSGFGSSSGGVGTTGGR